MLNKPILAAMSLFLIAISTVSAERNTTISIEAGKDEQGNTNSMVSADMALNNSKRLFFGVGSSKIPSGNEVIQSNLAFVGLSKEFTDSWQLTGMLDYSGLKDAFTIVSASAAMRYNHPVVYVELVPGLRRIRLTTIGNRDVFIGSSAFGLKTGVNIGDHFRISASSFSYQYSRDVSLLASFDSTRFFNEKTLLLSSGLLEKSGNIEMGLDFESISASIGANHSVSAIDLSESDYGYFVFDYYFSEAWALSLLLGKYKDTPEDQDNFSSLTVNYSF